MKALFTLSHLTKYYDKTCVLKDLSFEIFPKEILGVVGESGSGKSTLGRLLLRLIRDYSGKIFFQDRELSSLTNKEVFQFRKEAQMIFQDASSLDPRMSVQEIVREPLIIHKRGNKTSQLEAVETLFHQVGLNFSALRYRFPHELSGGQKQRVGIARALALRPKFLVCDEPVSSLDVSTSHQIINLLLSLQKELELSYFFITHDLALLSRVAHRTMVLYRGECVELGQTSTLLSHPQHPYTQHLIKTTESLQRPYESSLR